MNTIEQLVEALKELCEIVEYAIAQKSAKDLDSFTLQPAIAAIAAGEAELKREPKAWMDKHGNIDLGWDAILNPIEFTPLYTREETK